MKNWICVAATSLLALGSAHAAAETTASGLVYEAITVGTGAQPAPTDTVRVHYRGCPRAMELSNSLPVSGNQPR